MVLHNSKWDKKAKARYYKKHGITPDWVLEKQARAEAERDQVESNTWRYQDSDSEDERQEASREAAEKVNGIVDDGEHTVGQAAMRPIEAKVEKQVRYLPEEDTERRDEEDEQLIRGVAGKSMFEKELQDEQTKKKAQIMDHDDPTDFYRIQEDIERDKMAKDIRQKFQSVRNNNRAQTQDEVDIDAFLDDVDDIEQNGPKKKPNEEWLEDLLD